MASDTVRDRILATGQRITPQRDLVAGVLEQAERPLSAAELCEAVARAGRGVGRATVFRTLLSLEEAGIVQQVVLPGNQPAYLLCRVAGHHHHLVCRQCGAAEDLAEDEVAPFLGALEGAHHFRVDHSNFTVYGSCARCEGNEVSAP